MDMALDTIVPETLNWQHTDEGPEWDTFEFSSFPQCWPDPAVIRATNFFWSGNRTEISSCFLGFRTPRLHWSGHPFRSRSQEGDWILGHGKVPRTACLKYLRVSPLFWQASTWLSSDICPTPARLWLLFCAWACLGWSYQLNFYGPLALDIVCRNALNFF